MKKNEMGDKIQHTRGPWSSIQRERSLPHVMGSDHCRVTVVDDTHTGNEMLGNASLLTLAPTAPHDCDHDGCPGRENKRRLEAAAELVEAARELIAGADREGGSVRSVHRYDVDQLRAAIARWEGR